MGSGGEEEDAALSDFEDDDLEAAPVVLPVSNNLGAAESLRVLRAEFDAEHQARTAAESERNELRAKFERLKGHAQEMARQRDDAMRHRDEALRVKGELARQLEEALKQKEELQKQMDDSHKVARSEIELTARLLVGMAEKITGSVSGMKKFPAGLPRPSGSTHTGVAAIAYGFTKRMEEVVEEVVRQRDATAKARDELQQQVEELTRQRDAAAQVRDRVNEQLEQQNYSNAIELSQLEASASELRLEGERSRQEIERLKQVAAEKDELERNLKREGQRKDGLIAQQTSIIVAVGKSLLDTVRFMQSDAETMPRLPVANGEDIGPEILQEQAEGFVKLVNMIGTSWKLKDESLQKIKADVEITEQNLLEEKFEVAEKLKTVFEEKENALKTLSELRMTLMQRQLSLEGPENDVTEDALLDAFDQGEGNMQFQVIALQSELKELREGKVNTDSLLQKTRAELQDLKKLAAERTARIIQLEKREADLQYQVRALKEHLTAADEEVVRWKEAAHEEAAAGAAVAEEEERLRTEVEALTQQLLELKTALSETANKLRSKEEMSAAAILARTTAERALRVADERAAELRERMDEMARQFEESDRRVDTLGGLSATFAGCFDVCWPWLRGRGRPDAAVHGSAEMEQLMEPLV